MATPMTATQMVTALTKEGVKLKESTGWRTRNRNHKGSWGPVNGIVIHHTAGRDSLNLCINGTSALPGPLCHAHLAKNGTLTLVGNGRANHAGTFATNAHKAVVDESPTHPRPDSGEPIDGNRSYYGIEVENLGNGTDPYPAVQYQAAVKWAAAICRFHGWSADSVIGHKEGTRRKIDPSFSMTTFRKDVANRLNTATDKPAPAPTAPTAPEATAVAAPDFVSLGYTTNRDIDQYWYQVYWDAEYHDAAGNHGAGGKTIMTGAAQYQALVHLTFDNAMEGATIQVRAVEEDIQGVRQREWHITEALATNGKTFVTVPFLNYLGAGRRLSFEVAYFGLNGESALMTRCEVQAHVWRS